jgi:hypothetical protein
MIPPAGMAIAAITIMLWIGLPRGQRSVHPQPGALSGHVRWNGARPVHRGGRAGARRCGLFRAAAGAASLTEFSKGGQIGIRALRCIPLHPAAVVQALSQRASLSPWTQCDRDAAPAGRSRRRPGRSNSPSSLSPVHAEFSGGAAPAPDSQLSVTRRHSVPAPDLMGRSARHSPGEPRKLIR